MMLARTIASLSAALLAIVVVLPSPSLAETVEGYQARRPGTDAELRRWLENMVWYHQFEKAEIRAATGLADAEIDAALARFDISPATRPPRQPDAPLLVLPWPGGRVLSRWGGELEQTRQRETKFSVFAPWDPKSYLVLDMPEAIWSSGKLIYLAHVHLPTIWTEQGITLEKLEWRRRPDGGLGLARRMPNGIKYHAIIVPQRDAVRMKLTLTNGTDTELRGLRVQNCVLLKRLAGFDAPAARKIVSSPPYAACGSPEAPRWVITAWTPGGLVWENPRNPCFHSDPVFEDCAPGQTRAVYGWLSFYEGDDVEGEIARIDKTGWQKDLWRSDPGDSAAGQ